MRALTAIVTMSIAVVGASACATGTSLVTESNQPQADPETQLAQYVLAQEALAADDYSEARAALEALVPLVAGNLRSLAQAAAEADDVAAMRASFKPLSELVAKFELPRGYGVAYCPMYDGGSNWVQRDGPVRNPYYGSLMLTCGVVDAAPGAHMDHSPRHGGIVFMAPDSFHHLEGTYPEPGLFRLYATDNYREPVNVANFGGRAVLEEDYDPETDEFRELAAVELVPAPDGAYLEARVGNLAWPAEITTKVIFEEGFPEERFDFIFAERSVSTAAAPAVATSGIPGTTEAPPTITLAERIRPQIPERADEIASEIAARDLQIQDLISRGAFTEIFIPALQAKELALALGDHASQLPEDGQNAIKIAVRSLVRSAWLLDWYGDLGNKQQVNTAYEVFGSAVGEIARVYEVP